MACTKLFGVITEGFKFNRYTEPRLFGSFDRETIVLAFLLIKPITWINEWVWLVGVVIMVAPIRSGFPSSPPQYITENNYELLKRNRLPLEIVSYLGL